MSKKVSKINAIMAETNTLPDFAAVYFRVGNRPLTKGGEVAEGMTAVTSIRFAKYAWGTGAHVDQPSYGISFEGSNEILVIPAKLITQVIPVTVDEDDTNIPTMPE